MFRRSLILFGAIVFLGLVATIAYSLLGGGGPHQTIRDAQANYESGDYLRVINDLDLCERSYSLQRDPPKFRELLRLRYLSHMALENWPAALRDLTRLIALAPEPSETLQLDNVLLLARTGSGERALALAREFIAEHPDHPRALELAGEAAQSIYRVELQAIIGKLELDLGAESLEEARAATLAYLYRPDGDTEVRAALHTLRKLYSETSHLVAEWSELESRLRQLRTRVQGALQDFRRSLEVGGEPVAAFRVFALALLESERIDDLLVLCECYRLLFDHEYVPEAGEMAAWALASRGLPAAAYATATRWLPPGTAEERFIVPELTPGVAVLDLYTAAIFAAYEAGDFEGLTQYRPDLQALAEAGVRIWLSLGLSSALNAYHNGWRQPAENAFAGVCRNLRHPPPHGQVDLMPVVMPLRIDNLRELGATNEQLTTVYDEWIDARPTAVDALVALAEHHIAAGKFAGAMAAVARAQRLRSNDEDLLALRQRIAADLYQPTGQDGPGLLAQCRLRQVIVPEVPDPVCFLLCGETALSVKATPVAIACGRAAVDALPWSAAGRMLEARAELQLGNAETAASLMRDLLTTHEPTAAMLELVLETHQIAGRPAGDALWRSVRLTPPSSALAIELFAALRDAAPAAALPLARAVTADLQTNDPLALPLIARAAAAFARAGQTKTADELLHRIDVADPELADEVRTDLARAVASLLRARSRSGADDRALAARAVDWTRRYGLTTPPVVPPLLDLATELQATHPATAYAILTTALAAAAPEQRNGRSFALAGDLALRLGYQALAESHWTAALAFEDGRVAAEPLARLCFATDRRERAQQIYALADDTATTDPALALRCGNLAATERLTARSFAKNPADLLTHITVAVVGLPSQAADLSLEEAADREILLELASTLRTPELARLALPRAIEFAAAHPTGTARLLLARAHLLAEQPGIAAKHHEEIFKAGPPNQVFWNEIALASCRPGYEPTKEVGTVFSAAAAKGEFEDAPMAYVVATLRMADFVAGSGHQDIALGLRAQAWQRYDHSFEIPEKWQPTVASAEALVAAKRPLDAWWVLDRIRPRIADPDERAQLVQRMIGIATPLLLAEDPEGKRQRDAVYRAIRDLVKEDGAFGPAIHLLFAFGPRHPRLAPTADAARAMLRGHLTLVASGRDTPELLTATTGRLVQDYGFPATIEEFEAALARHPLALPIWQARAELLAATRRGAGGVADLRAALRHSADPDLQLDQITMAAEQFALSEGDIATFATLPEALRASERGRYAAGLIALRTGRPDDAVALLEGTEFAPERRLLPLAAALLQSSVEDKIERARASLRRLADDYASSSAARYAGSFARQLEPR